jgi:hypothetical protein
MNSIAQNPVTYPACFAGMDLDTVNYHLRQGYATKADAAQMVRWWNESGKRFTTATLREHAVVINRCECIAPYISISE